MIFIMHDTSDFDLGEILFALYFKVYFGHAEALQLL